VRPRSIVVVITVIAAVLVLVVVNQIRRARHAPSNRPSLPAVIPPIANVRAPARLNVVVSGDAAQAHEPITDSLCAILTRDFAMGNWLRVVPQDSAAIAILVRPELTARGVHVTLIDGATGRAIRNGDFVLPTLAPADSTTVTDSLVRDLAAKDAVTRALLAHNARVADSLRRAARAAARRPLLWWWPPSVDQANRAAASRDSLIRLLQHADSDIRARARRDTVTRTIVRLRLLRQVATQRDSLCKVWRWALHGVADELTAWMTGHRGIAQTQIAYVSHGQLRIVDADGANDRAESQGGTVLSPAWRHDGRALVYSILNDWGTQIVQHDLVTHRAIPLPNVPTGLNITPVYTPDDRGIVFAHGTEGGTSLVMFSLANRSATFITRNGHDDASPTFAPGGRRIAYSSARLSAPQIYSVAIDGSDDRQETPIMTAGRSYRASPDWSPDGRAIAFEQQNGNFQVWIVTLADRRYRRLTAAGENEDPSWAPDSRHLVFSSTRSGVKNLWVLDTESGRMRQLTNIGAARLAAWSRRGSL